MSFDGEPQLASDTVPPIAESVLSDDVVLPQRPRSRSRWWWLLTLLLALIWAVLHFHPRTGAANADVVHLTCGAHEVQVTVNPGGESVSALINNEVTATAWLTEAASGARYEGTISDAAATGTTPAGPLMLWNHQNEWMSTIGGVEDLVCTEN